MARSESKFTMRKTQTVSQYDSTLELRGEDRRRFFRNPSKYLQGLLRHKGLKYRKVTVSGLDRETVRKAMVREEDVEITVKGLWMHIDFDFIHHPSRECQWVYTVIIVVVSHPDL